MVFASPPLVVETTALSGEVPGGPQLGFSAAVRSQRRRLQGLVGPMRRSLVPTAQSLGDGLRDPNHEETLRRIPVVLTAFVNHPNVATLGGLLVGYHSIQFADLERSSVSSVVDANSELCRWSWFASHASIKQRQLQFEFLPSDPMRLIPVDPCGVNRPIEEANFRDTSQLPPAPSSPVGGFARRTSTYCAAITLGNTPSKRTR